MILALSAILNAQAPAADPNEVVLTVGDLKITAAQYGLMVKTLLPPAQQALAFGSGRRQIAEKMAGMFALAAEASRRNLDKRPDIADKIESERDKVLSVAMFQHMIEETVVPEADVLAYYNAHKNDYDTVKVRHILIHVKGASMPLAPGAKEMSEEEALRKAQSIRARLVAGEDFAEVAKKESDDALSRMKGGDLGEVKRGGTVGPFDQAAFALKPGDFSEPVRTEFGFHIIQVQSHIVRSLADVRPEILAKFKPDLARKAAVELTRSVKSHIDDGFFGPEPAAIATSGGK